MSEPGSNPRSDYDWRNSLRRFFRAVVEFDPFHVSLVVLVVALVIVGLPYLAKRAAIERQRNRVVVYCAQDQTYAEPLLKQFEQETGIKVKAVFDSEAVKTVGLANRLLAERNHPQCDVFWGNEELRTRQLAAQNVFRETNGWAAFGHRSRRMVVNTNLVSLERRPPARQVYVSSQKHAVPEAGAPESLLDLTNAIYRGQVALAYPQFGTTGAHFHALRQLWGESNWLAWCRALIANDAKLVDGNSVVVKLVGRGEAAIGLTDSDDILAGQREGLPVTALPLTPSLSPSDGERVAESRVRGSGEMLLIPNTVAVIRGAPHPAAAEKLFQFLQRREVAEKLVAAGALEDTTTGTNGTDWATLLRDLEATTKQLNEVFLK